MTLEEFRARLPAPRLALALGAALLALLAFLRLGLGGAERLVVSDALLVAEQVAEEAGALRRRAREAAAGLSAASAPMPAEDLLGRVLLSAREAGAEVRRLAPRTGAEGGLEAELAGPYPALLRVLAEMEALGAAPAGLTLRPAPEGGAAAEGGRGLSLSLAAPRRAAVRSGAPPRPEAARDLFAPGAAEGVPDLSARYRLTGLSPGLATVDGADYEPGDRLGGMVVVSISEEAVLLADEGGRHFSLRLPAAP